MGLFLLDLDGTLVDDAVLEVDGKLQRPQHQLFHEPVLRPNVFETLQRHAEEGDWFSIVTNQGGVAWGYHTKAEVYARIGRALQLLEFFWSAPFTVEVAFHHPRASMPQFKGEGIRKPSPAMLRGAMIAHGIDPGHLDQASPSILMLGDREEDKLAAEAAHVDFMLAGDFFGW
jgi:histidinol phosphatase-like enzyme